MKDPAAVKRGKQNRAAGKRWEREVARDLRAIFGNVWRGWQSRTGDNQADNEGVPLFWVECKFTKGVNFRAALRQATADSDGRWPLVIGKDRLQSSWLDKRRPWAVVAMWTADWLKFQELVTRAVMRAKLDSTDAIRPVEIEKTGGRVRISQTFLAHAQSLVKDKAQIAVPVVTIHDANSTPFTLLPYDDFKSVCEAWFDSLCAVVVEHLRE